MEPLWGTPQLALPISPDDRAEPSPATPTSQGPMNGDEPVPTLQVSQAELVHGLRLVTSGIRRRPPSQAVLAFEGDELTATLPGITLKATAHGHWPGEARVDGWFLRGLPSALSPAGLDTLITVRVTGQRCYVGRYSTPCVWQERAARIAVPLNPSVAWLLGLRFRCTDDEIARAGVEPMVRAAEAQRDHLIQRAAATLGPLGVNAPDLRQLVDECARKESEQ
jgi:hypothetical protein